jgi:hypothetical protein
VHHTSQLGHTSRYETIYRRFKNSTPPEQFDRTGRRWRWSQWAGLHKNKHIFLFPDIGKTHKSRIYWRKTQNHHRLLLHGRRPFYGRHGLVKWSMASISKCDTSTMNSSKNSRWAVKYNLRFFSFRNGVKSPSLRTREPNRNGSGYFVSEMCGSFVHDDALHTTPTPRP